MNELKIKKIDNKGFCEIGHIWNELSAYKSPDIFKLYEWVSNWWKIYGYDKELLVLLVEDGDRPIAIAPLVITRDPFNRIPARKVELMYRANFIISSRKKDVVRKVMGYLKDIEGSWDVIDFSDMEYDEEIIGLFEKEAEKLGLGFLVKEGDPYPYIEIDRPWEKYWSERKPSSRRNLNRLCRRIKEYGDMDMEFNTYDSSTLDKMNEDLEKVFALSLKSWKAKYNTAVGSTEDRRTLYKSIMELFSTKGRTEISFLKHKGRPISFCFGVTYEGVHYAFKTGYDDKYAHISPGNILLRFIIERLFNEGIVRLEFLKGLFPQKLIWLTGVHKKAHVMFFKDSLRSKTLRFSETHLRRLLHATTLCKKGV